jgi:hypothetical protein
VAAGERIDVVRKRSASSEVEGEEDMAVGMRRRGDRWLDCRRKGGGAKPPQRSRTGN